MISVPRRQLDLGAAAGEVALHAGGEAASGSGKRVAAAREREAKLAAGRAVAAASLEQLLQPAGVRADNAVASTTKPSTTAQKLLPDLPLCWRTSWARWCAAQPRRPGARRRSLARVVGRDDGAVVVSAGIVVARLRLLLLGAARLRLCCAAAVRRGCVVPAGRSFTPRVKLDASASTTSLRRRARNSFAMLKAGAKILVPHPSEGFVGATVESAGAEISARPTTASGHGRRRGGRERREGVRGRGGPDVARRAQRGDGRAHTAAPPQAAAGVLGGGRRADLGQPVRADPASGC